ncbi:methionine ABC transporter ATP-binding protein [Marisediminicola sp. LYQ85]|uniref:methionine ABC transporter ATP-binding protein n=1 Tax=Marisediminicola sp. LYQ85 TaxID=3391062 RepID=UPI003982F578
MTAIVEFRGVTKSFDTRQQRVHALHEIDLTIDEGEIFGVIGRSGAGKSTLVRLINGLERLSSGTLTVDGHDIGSLRERDLRAMRLEIGMIFQQFNLFRSRTVAGNVAYPLRVAGWPRADRDRRVAELLDFVGLLDRAHDYPEQLSGGQKQRVGIARALATSPRILLADEATSALDPETTLEVLRLLRKVNRELGITIVVITHEMDVVRAIADRVAVIEGGRIVEQGSVFDIFSAPSTDIAKRFIGTVIRNQPDADDLERLQSVHEGRIVTVDIREYVQIGHVLGRAHADHGVDFEVVFGGIGAIQERSFGSLTLELTGPTGGVDALIGHLRDLTTVTEVAR